MEHFFVETGVETYDTGVQPPSFDKEQKQKTANLAPKHDVELKQADTQSMFNLI